VDHPLQLGPIFRETESLYIYIYIYSPSGPSYPVLVLKFTLNFYQYQCLLFLVTYQATRPQMKQNLPMTYFLKRLHLRVLNLREVTLKIPVVKYIPNPVTLRIFISPKQCYFCVCFCVELRTNSNYFPIQ
jgi:hypothetical protein